MVLGIDPGTRVVGYGAIACHRSGPQLLAAGVIRAGAKQAVPDRLGLIRSEIDRLLELLKPQVVVVEEAYAGQNVQSALRIGEGRGVALSCAAVLGAQIRQFPPAVAKKAVCGNGRASKLQVAAMIRVLLGEGAASLPEDASDALALALAHVQENALADKLTGRLKSHT